MPSLRPPRASSVFYRVMGHRGWRAVLPMAFGHARLAGTVLPASPRLSPPFFGAPVMLMECCRFSVPPSCPGLCLLLPPKSKEQLQWERAAGASRWRECMLRCNGFVEPGSAPSRRRGVCSLAARRWCPPRINLSKHQPFDVLPPRERLSTLSPICCWQAEFLRDKNRRLVASCCIESFRQRRRVPPPEFTRRAITGVLRCRSIVDFGQTHDTLLFSDEGCESCFLPARLGIVLPSRPSRFALWRRWEFRG